MSKPEMLALEAIGKAQNARELAERLQAEVFPALSNVNDTIERLKAYESTLAFAIYFVSVSHLTLRDLLIEKGVINLFEVQAAMEGDQYAHKQVMGQWLELAERKPPFSSNSDQAGADGATRH